MMMLYYVLWGALIAEIAGTIAGFGSSSIFLPIVHQLMSYHNAIVLVAIYHIFGNVSRLSMFWRHWDKRIFILFGVPSVIATVIWAYLSSVINPAWLKICLWIVLIIFALYSLYQPTLKIVVSPWVARVWWALSWFTAWLIGTWWVLRWAFMTLFGLTKESYVATIASVALLVDMTRIPLYFGQWFMDERYRVYIPLLLVVAFIWSWIGKRIVSRIDAEMLRVIILYAIIVVSALLVVQSWWAL